MVFVFYPVSVWLISFLKGPITFNENTENPTVSIIVVLRNGEEIIRQKIENSLKLDYESNKLQLVFFSDGSTDKTVEIIREYENPNLLMLSSASHIGKAPGINEAVKQSSGEILIFSDTDAILDKTVIKDMVRHYDDPNTGGVCGQRVIYKQDISTIKDSQQNYINFDSKIKFLESHTGSITSNDGKLYSIRKSLFKPIEPDVTDDLYSCLSVIEQGYRFSFEPHARAYIRTPSRSPLHEIKRRRRVVARSLRGIYYKRPLLNPFKHGFFAVGLFVNKVIRRLLPICLILIFITSATLAMRNSLFIWVWILQLLFYTAGLFAFVVDKYHIPISIIRKPLSLILYFCVGMYGTLIGFIDFISLKKYTKWDPKKTG
jgi:cellulose synthase/poly-beta-1,6-N-acetylglucosamine synthase-like glycosyltransferase